MARGSRSLVKLVSTAETSFSTHRLELRKYEGSYGASLIWSSNGPVLLRLAQLLEQSYRSP